MPITSNLDRVRLLIRDTSSTDPLLTDDEVNRFITDRTELNDTGGTVAVNLPAAAADAAGAIAAEFARTFDFSEDGQQFQRAQRVGHYMALERDLRNRAGGYSVPLGGTTTT